MIVGAIAGLIIVGFAIYIAYNNPTLKAKRRRRRIGWDRKVRRDHVRRSLGIDTTAIARQSQSSRRRHQGTAVARVAPNWPHGSFDDPAA